MLLMFYCDKKFIGNVIKTFRKKSKIKQSELAEKIGISEKHLSKIETGKNYPSLDNFLKMADILKFKLDDFGLNTSISSDNPDKNRLIKLIYEASDCEISSYLKIIDAIKEIIR